MVEPMAETSATVEPEMPEKMYSATTTAIESPAADPSHQHLGQPDEADGDAARLHERAGEDEERDGEEDERIHTLEGLLDDDGEGILAGPDEPEEAREPDDEGDGDAEEEQDDEREGDEQNH